MKVRVPSFSIAQTKGYTSTLNYNARESKPDRRLEKKLEREKKLYEFCKDCAKEDCPRPCKAYRAFEKELKHGNGEVLPQ